MTSCAAALSYGYNKDSYNQELHIMLPPKSPGKIRFMAVLTAASNARRQTAWKTKLQQNNRQRLFECSLWLWAMEAPSCWAQSTFWISNKDPCWWNLLFSTAADWDASILCCFFFFSFMFLTTVHRNTAAGWVAPTYVNLLILPETKETKKKQPNTAFELRLKTWPNMDIYFRSKGPISYLFKVWIFHPGLQRCSHAWTMPEKQHV